MIDQTSYSYSILIADDDAVCRDLLETLLESLGYTCLTASDGEEALEIIEREQPEVVLLDLNMPKMNGNAVMQCLKDRGIINEIQIIVISAEEDTHSVAQSIEFGADDHIVKPFNTVILNARIESSVAKHRLRKMQLHEQERLEELVEKRTQELKLANKRLLSLDKAKNEFLNVLSHELRTPLNGIEIAKILIEERDELTLTEHQQLYADLLRSIDQLNEMINHAMILSQLAASPDQPKTRQTTPANLLSGAGLLVDGQHARMLDQPILSGVTGDMMIPCHDDLLNEALGAILKLASKFSDQTKKVTIHVIGVEDSLRIVIKSWGYRLPEKHIGNLFKVMAIPDSLFPGGDLGLSAPMARQVLISHGGEVSARNHDEGGVIFNVSIPMEIVST
ncbi:hybrid sensor histidine kinase/response regulator [Coraliomargarita sp. W4R72]